MRQTAAKAAGRNKGFTLIELLVVIAIIAILASILFPVFARARDNARRTTCISNLKQIGLGMMQYTQDYDERYPDFIMGWANGQLGPDGHTYYNGAASWQQLTYPYTKSLQIYFCPSSSYSLNATTQDDTGDPYGNMMNGNYGMLEDAGRKKLSAISSPALKFLFMEFGLYETAAQYVLSPTGSSYMPGVGNRGISCAGVASMGQSFLDDCNSGRHFGGITIGYADGHVKWLSADKVIIEAKAFTTPGNGAFKLNTDT